MKSLALTDGRRSFLPVPLRTRAISIIQDDIRDSFGSETVTQYSNAEESYRLAKAAYSERQYDRAVPHIRRALELDPRMAQGHGLLARIHYATSKFEAARESVERAIDLDSECDEYELLFGMILDRLGCTSEAMAHFERASVLSEYPDIVMATQAEALARAGEFNAAEELFRKAHAIAPDSPLILRDFGRLLDHLDRHKEAEDLFLKAIEAGPSDKRSHFRYGEFLSKFKSRREEARKHLEQALRIDPDYQEAKVKLELLVAGDTTNTQRRKDAGGAANAGGAGDVQHGKG